MGLKTGTKFKVEIGDIFGEWTILDNNAFWKKGYYFYRCKCSCGTERLVQVSNLKRGISTNCGCIKRNNPAHNYKGIGNLSQKYFSRLKSGSIKRDLEFDLTKEYLLSIFDGTCKLSGIEISLNRNTELQTASVDRIESDKGYIKGNVQWIHKKLNWLKRNMTDDEFINWCKLVANYKQNENV